MKINVIKQNRRTISMKFDNDLLIVKAPKFLLDSEINDFINKNLNKLYKKLERSNEITNKLSDLLNGGVFLIFGEKSNISLSNKKEYIKIAENYLRNRVEILSNAFNFKFNKLIVKNYKARWGSCDRYKNISLNYKLLMLKKELIDYVIIHELCHLTYLNHSKNFYSLLYKLFPDAKKLKNEIKKYSYYSKI